MLLSLTQTRNNSYTSYWLLRTITFLFIQWHSYCCLITGPLINRDSREHPSHTSQHCCWHSLYSAKKKPQPTNQPTDSADMTVQHMLQTRGGAKNSSEGIHIWWLLSHLPILCWTPRWKAHSLVLEGQADLGFIHRKSKWHINSEVSFGHLIATSSSYVVIKLFLVCKPHLCFLYHRNKVFIN